jgi:hypothetical protein
MLLKRSALIILAFSCLFLNGCISSKVSKITLHFNADREINENVLLPLDVVVVDKSLSETVLSIGPDDWFGDSLRDRLVGEEVHHLAIKGGATREITVKIPEETNKVIIYADYENNIDRLGQQIVIAPKKAVFSPNYKVLIRDKNMELAQ